LEEEIGTLVVRMVRIVGQIIYLSVDTCMPINCCWCGAQTLS